MIYSDEGQQRAANMMYSAAEKYRQASESLQENLSFVIPRLEEIISRFENAVERLILDYPGG